MNLLKHYTVASGYSRFFAPGEGRLKHLTLGVLRLTAKLMFTFVPEPGCEAALTIITGSLDASALVGQRWEGLGGRSDVFAESTDTLFIPADSQLDLHTLTECEIVIAQVQSNFQGVPTLFVAAHALIEQRGNPGWRREVRTYLHSTANVGRLILAKLPAKLANGRCFRRINTTLMICPPKPISKKFTCLKLTRIRGSLFREFMIWPTRRRAIWLTWCVIMMWLPFRAGIIRWPLRRDIAFIITGCWRDADTI